LEKERLEIIKRRCEIAALRKQHQLPEFDSEPVVTLPQSEVVKPVNASLRKPTTPPWLLKLPHGFAKTLLYVSQWLLSAGMAVSVLTLIGMVAGTIALFLTERDSRGFEHILAFVFIIVLYAFLLWDCYALFQKVRRLRTLSFPASV
jgi:uncharacterized protein with PQ loop repeat